MIRINELSLPLDHTADELRAAIVKRLGIGDADLLDFSVFKRSYDARKKNSVILFIYIIDLQARGEGAILARFAGLPRSTLGTMLAHAGMGVTVIGLVATSAYQTEKIAAMRSVPEDVLRKVANDRQWARSYAVVHNLARNPRTPVANVMNILSRLQLKDLAALSKNKNVSDTVRRQAHRLSQARTGK